MIQRIQSLFLVAIIIIMGWFCFTKIWVKINDKTADEIIFTPISLTYESASTQMSNLQVIEISTLHILVLAALITFLAIISLFNYKKRVTQMKFGFLNTLLIIILFALMYYQIVEADKMMSHPLYGEYRMGFFLPLFALGFNILANYYIKRDEDLVRSADRIR
jgi:peptidoglycan/LPS O-acetylase OafA/YrhL